MRQTLSKLGRAVLFGVVSAIGLAGAAQADVVADQSGAILVYPKIIFDSGGVFNEGNPTDTLLQLTNTSNSVVAAHCVLVDTTSRCDGDGDACTPETAISICGSIDRCVQRWVPRDFRLTLTKRQPLAWRASEGQNQLPCDQAVGGGGCPFGQSNTGADGLPSSIPPVGDDPFFGELKCVQVDPESFAPAGGLNPANGGRGDLAGHATIVSVNGTGDSMPDARKYNALGIQATDINNNDGVLQVGGPGAEYNACPHTLLLNHVFDNATVEAETGSAEVTTDLTVVPCSQDLGREGGGNAVVLQFLVFNEFEQRFSASTSVDCWREIQLSDIDSRPGPFGNSTSIFNVSVQGTITGQTRIRPVAGANSANAVLGIAEEFWDGEIESRTTAANLHYVGVAAGGDQIIIPSDVPNGGGGD